MTTLRVVRRLASAVLAGALLVGCQGMPLDLSKRTVTDRAQIDAYKGRRIVGEATGFQLLLFIPIAINNRYQTAYNDLLRQAGDDLLSDVTVTESWQWAAVGTLYTTRIEATAYPRKAPAPTQDGGSTRR
ncbi:hypothetical protein [Piscinibacter gummiphilus]|uniref:Uncharacterized protein n=1 Tax=Piscinibacter gummiphilus TaxID=946333 RepID=A0ABZ0CT88_9BURK|nr:hypothetical protein [Piscinibacter gummiphilus]WOB08194.1 hypothetical protein RXV79_25240 [Piscinibacter gummiphilus]